MESRAMMLWAVPRQGVGSCAHESPAYKHQLAHPIETADSGLVF